MGESERMCQYFSFPTQYVRRMAGHKNAIFSKKDKEIKIQKIYKNTKMVTWQYVRMLGEHKNAKCPSPGPRRSTSWSVIVIVIVIVSFKIIFTVFFFAGCQMSKIWCSSAHHFAILSHFYNCIALTWTIAKKCNF